jgi:cytochrome P450
MLYIMTSPRVYRQLQAEIDTAALNGKISRPVVRDAEARTLPYLQAVIHEGLRIHPPATGLLSKVTPPEGDTINGVFVPGGTNVASNTWAVMRNKDIFGADCDCFRPERWIEADEEGYTKMLRVVELAFGSGRYKCLGRTVAGIELNKIFVEVSSVACCR